MIDPRRSVVLRSEMEFEPGSLSDTNAVGCKQYVPFRLRPAIDFGILNIVCEKRLRAGGFYTTTAAVE